MRLYFRKRASYSSYGNYVCASGTESTLVGGSSGGLKVTTGGDLYTNQYMLNHASSIKTANEELGIWVLVVHADGTPMVCAVKTLSCYRG